MAVLKEQLEGMGVYSASHLIAQCYDGASVMSGRLAGLQALMRQSVCPLAIYVHCWAHRLNLVVVACVYGIDRATWFFEHMQTLYKFFSASVPHDYFQAVQQNLRENTGDGKALTLKELKSLSKTRWCCQAEACDAVVATLGSIIATVEHFADDDYRDRQAAAQTIVGFIDTDFVVCLVLFQNVIRKCSVAANYLQSTEMDTSTAVELVTALKDALSTPELFGEIWTTATALTQAHDIAAPLQIRRRQCRADANQHTWTRRDYKEQVFDKVIKLFVDELEKRFDTTVCDILRAMASLVPQSTHFLDFETLKPFVIHYSLDAKLLKSEIDVFSAQYKNAEPGCKSLLDVLQFVEPFKTCYAQLYKAIVTAVTIPITTAENERSFSCLKRTKTYTRSVMNDERLGDLGTLSINRERTSNINFEDIVDAFASLSDRRMGLI